MYKKVLILLFFIPFQLLFAQTSMLKDFPEGSTPEEIGKRLAYRFLTEKHALHVGKWIGYPETFYWNGALRYAYLAKDKELLNRLQDKFDTAAPHWWKTSRLATLAPLQQKPERNP